MADKYSSDHIFTLADENNLILPNNTSKQIVYDLLLLLGIIDTHPNDKYEYGGKRPQIGIVGWDIPYTSASWVTKLTGTDWNPRLNPILNKDLTWVYHLDYMNVIVIDATLSFIKKSRKDNILYWDSLYPKVLNLDMENIIEEFRDFMNFDEPWITALAGWDGHMRFLYHDRDTRTLTFYDPWKRQQDKTKFFKKMQKDILAVYRYNVIFENREKDQSEENSCVVDSLARVLMMGEHGQDASTWEWDLSTYDYAVFAARAMRIQMKNTFGAAHTVSSLYR